MPRCNHPDSNFKELHAQRNNKLVNISEEKYLGVIIDYKLKFEDYIGGKVEGRKPT